MGTHTHTLHILVTSTHWTLSWLFVTKSVFQRVEGVITLQTEDTSLGAFQGRETWVSSSCGLS